MKPTPELAKKVTEAIYRGISRIEVSNGAYISCGPEYLSNTLSSRLIEKIAQQAANSAFAALPD